jgi:DNA-binding NtrC family response regulator
MAGREEREGQGNGDPRLVLLLDHDTESRRAVGPMLARQGYDVVQAASALVGLELIQRLPTSFRLVLADLELEDLPGRLLVETLAHCRPDLPVVCMQNTRYADVTAMVSGCLAKPLRAEALEGQIRAAFAGTAPWTLTTAVTPEVAARARERYAETGDLVEAAFELARGLPPED